MKPVFFILITFLFFFSHSLFSQFPTNFTQVEVASGISNPTAMAFAPDGRIFVAQQNGVLLVIKNGVKLSTPAIQLSVSSTGERGLSGIALHPSFSTNGLVYLYYTLPDGSRNRVSRFSMSGDVLNPSSETIIFDLDVLSTSLIHNSGAMHFIADKLYISTGDNANSANAQSLATTHGKILRINADGSVPDDNPFYSPTGTRQRNAIWAYGLRNPFTFDVQPGTNRILVNDVGQESWEEVNDATVKGKNFGWPGSEGMTSIAGYTPPIYTYAHGSGDGVGCAITGGVFFNPTITNYPTAYIGKYFFVDYCNAWINYIDVTSGAVRSPFATRIAGQSLAIDVGLDGNLYFLTRAGRLNKVVYKPGSGGNTSPTITDQPDNVFAAIGQSSTFSVSASGTLPISYQWRKNGQDISGANASSYTISSVQQSDAGQYTVRVYNTYGQALSTPASLDMNQNSLADVQITTPASGAMYRGGEQISFSGTAIDPEDGALPASAFSWSVEFHHDTHVHDGPPIAQGVMSGSFTIPNSGETASNVFYRLHLTVKDSQGLTSSTFVDIKPFTSVMTLKTHPAGLNLTMDGQPVITARAITSVEGIQRTIGVVSPQTVNSVSYAFASWAHGGTDSQTIPTPVDNTTYIANFSQALTTPWRSTDIGKLNVVGNASISNGTFTLSASGLDIYNAADHFRFVYQPLSGNTDIRARVTGITNTHAWAKAGVMIRETLQPNSKHAMVIVTPTSGTSFQRRTSTGGSTTANNSTGAAPYWLRLVRGGNTFTAYTSSNGSTWTMIGSPISISMTSDVYVGLAYTSHSSSVSGTSTMTNVTLTAPASATGAFDEEVVVLEDENLSMYPNPVEADLFYLKIPSKEVTSHRVEILNGLGQVVFDHAYDPDINPGGLYEINVSGVARGFYFVRVSEKERRLTTTFIRK